MDHQNLSQYKIFYEVAKAGNISKAAKELFISQPAISKVISKLEENLEITLFTRNSRGVALTMEGQTLYEHISEAFRHISLGEKQIRRLKELKLGKIRIGVSTTLCKYILLPKLKKFVSEYPHVMVNIASQATYQTEVMIENGLLDLGVVATSGHKKNFGFRKIMEIHDIFIASPKYLEDMYFREESSSDIFANCNLIMLDKNNMTRKYVDTYLDKNNFSPNQLLEVTTMDLLIEFTKIGLGIGCAIKEFVQKELDDGSLVEVSLPFKIDPRSVGYYYSNSNPNPMLKNFLNM